MSRIGVVVAMVLTGLVMLVSVSNPAAACSDDAQRYLDWGWPEYDPASSAVGRVLENGVPIAPGKPDTPDKKESCPTTEVVSLLARIAALRGEPFVLLLGEVHDNRDHHRFRARLIELLAGGKHQDAPSPNGTRSATAIAPALVFEHIRADQQAGLDAFAAIVSTGGAPGSPEDFFRLLEWDKSGWPERKLFEPIFSAAIRAKLPIYPGDLGRNVIRKAAKDGEAVLSPQERFDLGLDKPLSQRLQDALLTELEESHCGMMPKTAFGNMAFAQRYRDAHLADAVIKVAAIHGSVILLAGNGHIRKDRGVPSYLRQRAPQHKTVSVMLIEAEDGKIDPQAYVPSDPEGRPAAEFIVVTPRQARPDPCEQMRAAMKARKG